MSDTAAAAPTGAPAGGGLPGDPGSMITPLPPSKFDEAMAQMDFLPKEPAPLARVPAEPSNKIAPPPDQTIDPNVATRDQAQQLERDDSVQAQVLNTEEQKQYEDWKARRDSPILHETEMEKLVSVPWREGEQRDVSVQEAVRGYMRQVDYTRGTQETAQIRQQAENTLQNVNRLLTDLGNAATLRTRLEDLGFGEALHAAAEQIYNERLAEERQLYSLRKRGATQEELAGLREVFADRRAANARARRLELQAQNNTNNFQQQQQQAQQQRQAEQLEHQLRQLRPAAFKAVGIPSDSLHEGIFGDQFLAILNSPRARQMQLRDIVIEATHATKQFVEDRIAAHSLSQQEATRAAAATAPAAPLSPARLAGPAAMPTNGVTQARNKRLGLKDFDAEMERMSR